jgi:hypothetical protein
MATRIAPQTESMITGEELAALSSVGLCELVAGSIVPVIPMTIEDTACWSFRAQRGI